MDPCWSACTIQTSASLRADCKINHGNRSALKHSEQCFETTKTYAFRTFDPAQKFRHQSKACWESWARYVCASRNGRARVLEDIARSIAISPHFLRRGTRVRAFVRLWMCILHVHTVGAVHRNDDGVCVFGYIRLTLFRGEQRNDNNKPIRRSSLSSTSHPNRFVLVKFSFLQSAGRIQCAHSRRTIIHSNRRRNQCDWGPEKKNASSV